MDAPGPQYGATLRFFYSLILTQRTAIEELKAATRELAWLIEDVLCLRPGLRPTWEGAIAARSNGALVPAPAVPALEASEFQLKRDGEQLMIRGRDAIRDSAVIRFRSERLREALHANGRRLEAPVVPGDSLSRREHEVLHLMVAGKSSKEIAADLGISFKTAVTHRASIMSKLDVHEVASVVREAIIRGLV